MPRPRRFGGIGNAALIAALLGPGCDSGSRSDPSPGSPPPLRNLILVSIDTQRADRLVLHGGDVETLNLEAIAERGTLFERAYAHAPMTAPSHGSLFTSLLLSEHGLQNNGQALPSELTTLAELLQQRGLRTGAFVSLAVLWHKFGLNAGFDSYFDEATRKAWWLTAGELNAEALPWIERVRREPFFAFLHYSDPHAPYLPPSLFQQIEVAFEGKASDPIVVDGRRISLRTPLSSGSTRLALTLRGDRPVRIFDWKPVKGLRVEIGTGFSTSDQEVILTPGVPGELILHDDRPDAAPREIAIRFRAEPQQEPDARRRAYDLETEYVDEALGELVALLDRHDLWKTTALVVTADHGEELGEHDGRFGHTERLHETVIRVPLIIVAPGFFEPATRVEEVVRHIDVLPTLAQVLGFPVPEGARGASLWPTRSIGPRVAIAETFRPQAPVDRVAAVGVRFKLERSDDDGSAVLYDLLNDAGEREPLRMPPAPGSEWEPVFRKLEAALDQAIPVAEADGSDVPLDEEDIEALRALGYVE
jgi:membrane-anchored protein YejM (alkaline phosphatase superfamily)